MADHALTIGRLPSIVHLNYHSAQPTSVYKLNPQYKLKETMHKIIKYRKIGYQVPTLFATTSCVILAESVHIDTASIGLSPFTL